MKTLSILLFALMIFTAVPAFACGSSCGGGDKGKDDQAFTNNTQNLCGGGEDKSADYLCSGSGCKKDKPKPEPKPDSGANTLCGGSCGGGKGDKPAPNPQLL